MQFLVFQLQATLASWGDVAVGEYRGSSAYPGESALVGLLGAALGVRREEETTHASLRDGYRFAIGVLSTGNLLRDYHTVQVPGRADLKGRPHRSRRDELALPKDKLNTILSTRDYRENSSCVIAVQAQANAPYSLSALADALQRPRFVLYLGRKSCPPNAPLDPQILDDASALSALQTYLVGRQPSAPPLQRIAWSDGVHAGVAAALSSPRKDRLIRRRGWQFGDRIEHTAMLEDPE